MKLCINLRQAFTLVEMLVALAVGAIVIMATYASYEMVDTQYKKNIDVANMHTSGRAIMQMIERDVRMAGFEYRHTSGTNKGKKTFSSGITTPLNIKDSGNKCCDEVTVVYDHAQDVLDWKGRVVSNKVERIRVRYWAEIHLSNKGNRHRLYKQKDILGQNQKILTKPTLGNKAVMADYIEDLQLDQDSNLDQSQTVYDAGMSARTINNRSYYQTFTSGKTGTLSKIDMGFFAGCCPHQTWRGTALLRIYKGQDTGGSLLSSSTVPAITNAERITVNSWNVSVPVVAGEKYTFDFKPLKGVPDPYGIAVSTNNKYTAGTMGECIGNSCQKFNKFDMYFQTFVGKGNHALVKINLILRTKNQYGKDRQFKKKDYHPGNYKLDKTDKYKRDTFSSTVLVRNLAL